MYDADAKEISEPRSEDLLVDSPILGSERGMLDCGIFTKRYLDPGPLAHPMRPNANTAFKLRPRIPTSRSLGKRLFSNMAKLGYATLKTRQLRGKSKGETVKRPNYKG